MSVKLSVALSFAKRGLSLDFQVHLFSLLQEGVVGSEADTHWVDFRGEGAVHAGAFAHAVGP